VDAPDSVRGDGDAAEQRGVRFRVVSARLVCRHEQPGPHPRQLGANVAADWRQRVGDPDGAFRDAPVVMRTTLRLARGGAHPLEPRGLVALWDGGRLTVSAAIQMVHRHRTMIAGQLGLPEDRVISSASAR
jgi:carbon-monoxide dehydrogenase large subunit